MSPGAWLPIADAIAKATLLILAGAIGALVLRRASAASRHLVWTLALVSALALPALSLALPKWQLPIVTLTGQEAPPEPPAAQPTMQRRQERPAAIAAPDGSSTAPAAPRTPVSWPTVIFLVWAAGAAAILARLAAGLLAVHWITRRTERVNDAPWLPLARDLAKRVGVSPRILFLTSGRAAMPMAWGMVLPSVLMPADADTWPAERLRIVLLHELAHVKRRDCLTHVLAQIACALYWFNPIVWMAARRVRTERERACDDLVLVAGTPGPDYAEELLEIARVMRSTRFPVVLAGASLAMAHRSQLEGRLMAILDPTVPRAGVSRIRIAGATALLACGLMPLASLQPWAYAAAPDSFDTSAVVPAGRELAAEPAAVPHPAPRQSPTPVTTTTASGSSGARTNTNTNTNTNSNRNTNTNPNSNSNTNVNSSGGAETNVRLQSERARQLAAADADKAERDAPQAADPRTVAALTAALKDSDKDVRETALHALVQLRDPSVFEPLMQALSDTSPDVREQAAFGLGQLRDKRAVEPLVKLLKDTNADVREQAAFALSQIRDRSAVPALVAALKDTDADVRQQAAFALSQLRDPAAIEGLSAALHDTKPDVRQQAAFALSQLRDPRTVEPLISALKDGEADVRQQAAFALGQIRDRRAVEALVVALKDNAADVRQQAAFALGQLRDPRAIDGLTAALKDPSADVRQQAAFALGQLIK